MFCRCYAVCLCCPSYNLISFFCIFFFKQKTAYEMRISDWSSDVCSSDLDLPFDLELDRLLDITERVDVLGFGARAELLGAPLAHRDIGIAAERAFLHVAVADAEIDDQLMQKIGRASCRESVCQYV